MFPYSLVKIVQEPIFILEPDIFQFSTERVFIWKIYMLSCCKLSIQSVDASVKVSNTNTSYFIWSLNEESLIIKLIVYTTTIQLTTLNKTRVLFSLCYCNNCQESWVKAVNNNNVKENDSNLTFSFDLSVPNC